MMRYGWWLVLMLGCGGPPQRKEPDPARERALRYLQKRAERAEKLIGFRARYLLRDESTGRSVRIDLAFRAPDLARLLYPGQPQVYYRDGVCHVFGEGGYYRLPYRDEFARIAGIFRETLERADRLLGRKPPAKPQLMFHFGRWDRLRGLDRLHTSLHYSTFRGRFGWLLDLRDPSFTFDGSSSFRRDGGTRRASLEIRLNESGLIARARVIPIPLPGRPPHHGFVLDLEDLTLGRPPDEVFELPSFKGRTDNSAGARDRLLGTLADNLQRSLLRRLAARFRPPVDEGFEEGIRDLLVSYYRTDLQRTYEVKKMVEIVRSGEGKLIDEARKDIRSSPARETRLLFHRERLQARRTTSLRQIDEIDRRIRKDYRRFLATALPETPASIEVRDRISLLSEKALRSVIDEDLRKPVEAVYAEMSRRLK